MGTIVTVVCILAGILIAVALYSGSRQKLFIESYSRDLQNSLIQAQEVKCDLEEMMLNTITISREIVDGLEGKIIPTSKPLEQKMADAASTPAPKSDTRAGRKPKESSPALAIASGEGTNRVRVYELAEELGISTRDFMRICQDAGFKVTHHMNVLNEEQIEFFRQGEHQVQSEIKDEVPAQAVYTEEPAVQTQIAVESPPLKNIRSSKGTDFTLEEIKQAHPYIAVRMLGEQGYNQKEIAQILDRGQGEVSLILNLAKKKQACI